MVGTLRVQTARAEDYPDPELCQTAPCQEETQSSQGWCLVFYANFRMININEKNYGLKNFLVVSFYSLTT